MKGEWTHKWNENAIFCIETPAHADKVVAAANKYSSCQRDLFPGGGKL